MSTDVRYATRILRLPNLISGRFSYTYGRVENVIMRTRRVVQTADPRGPRREDLSIESDGDNLGRQPIPLRGVYAER